MLVMRKLLLLLLAVLALGAAAPTGALEIGMSIPSGLDGSSQAPWSELMALAGITGLAIFGRRRTLP